MPHPKRKIPRLVYRPVASAQVSLPDIPQPVTLTVVHDQRNDTYPVFASHDLVTPIGRGPLTVVVGPTAEIALEAAQADFQAFHGKAVEAGHQPGPGWLRAKG